MALDLSASSRFAPCLTPIQTWFDTLREVVVTRGMFQGSHLEVDNSTNGPHWVLGPFRSGVHGTYRRLAQAPHQAVHIHCRDAPASAARCSNGSPRTTTPTVRLFAKSLRNRFFSNRSPKFLRDFVDDITPAMTPLENAHFRVPRRISASLNPSPIGGRVQGADKRARANCRLSVPPWCPC